MRLRRMYAPVLGILMLMMSTVTWGQVRFNSPHPGDIYREYVYSMNGSNELMVPDPNLDLVRYPQMIGNVPAPVLPLVIGDLNGAIRAEAVIVYIGGHISTVGQKMRWNQHDWIDIPLLDTSNGIPVGHHGYNYLMLHNITMDIPLDQLVQGTNYFQGTSGTQATPQYSFMWGQWGWYAMMIRIYYGPDKPHATGVITSPTPGSGVNENPVLTANITSGLAQQVDFLAYYEDYDTDGDGVYLQYHHDYMMVKNQDILKINNHIGTATSAPWSATWNTTWVPDQPAGLVKMIARIRDNNDVWYVTPEVTQLSLVRSGRSIRFYKPLDMPERAWAKGDVGEQVIHVNIPSSDVIGDATAARYYIRTWNGANVITEPGDTEYRNFNNWTDAKFGEDHHYSLDARDIPLYKLQSGTNTFAWFTTCYLHHAIELLWPGPAVAVTYTGNYASPVPGMASLAAPANNVTGQVPILKLRWHPALVASSYDVQVSTDSLFGSIAAQFTSIADTSVQAGPLAGNTKYFWRVRGKNAAGVTEFTKAWTFTTLAPAAVPTQVAPANNAVDQALGGSVRWHAVAGADRYHVQVGGDSLFVGTILVNDSTLTDTVRVFSGLAYDTPYYWRVRSFNGAGPSAYSTVWKFRTIVNVPGVVTQIAPGDRATIAADSVQLRWGRTSPAASRYWLQVSIDSSFNQFSAVDSSLTDTVKTFRPLLTGTTYFWRVRGGSAGGWGNFSSVRRFGALFTDVHEQPGVPLSDALQQNYPNPFNPETRITFMVGEGVARHVRLAIYDVFGREVTVLVDERKGPGRYAVKWNAAGMASGVYFYRLQIRPSDSAIGRDSRGGAGNFTDTKRLVLVR